ncbi:MAG: hypothetical protein Q9183_008061 [Haloplaca sp. 2 TL-2023]
MATATATLSKPTPKTYPGTTTLVETISVTFPASAVGISLLFPSSVSLPSSLSGWSISTTYVLSFPSSIIPNETTASSTASTASSSSDGSSNSKTTKVITTTPSGSTSTSVSLCFDPTEQAPVPCSPTASSTAPYPVMTTLHSSATESYKMMTAFYLVNLLILLYAYSSDESIVALIALLWWAFGGVMILFFCCKNPKPAVSNPDEEKASIESSVEWWFKEKANESALERPKAVYAGSEKGKATHGV